MHTRQCYTLNITNLTVIMYQNKMWDSVTKERQFCVVTLHVFDREQLQEKKHV